MNRLFQSSKFWLLVIDAVFSLLVYFVGKYAGAALEDLKFVITVIQPVIGLVIAGIFIEDAALKAKSGQPILPPEK